MAVDDAPRELSATRKSAISIALGLACLAGSFRTFNASFPPHDVTIVWSLFLPMLAALAWGWRYALLAATVGGAGFVPFLLWPSNGYANAGAFALYGGWLVWHGIFASFRRARPALWNGMYVAQLLYTPLIAAILLGSYPTLFRLNPPPWAPGAATAMSSEILGTIAVKDSFVLLLHIVVCDAALSISTIRRLFGLSVSSAGRMNLRIIGGAIAAGAILFAGFIALDATMQGRAAQTEIRDGMSPEHQKLLLFVSVLSLVAGVQLARYVERRLEVEAALQESERRYRTLFESATDAVLVLRDGLVADCNLRTLDLFGCTRDEILGTSAVRFSPPRQPDGSDSSGTAGKRIEAALAGEARSFEWLHTRWDGGEFHAEVNLTRVDLLSGPHIVANVRDVSERKRLESQLRQAQKMEAIGQLAGGVAHDFNNLLTVIMGYAGLLALELEGDPKKAELAGHITKAAEKSAKLTGQLLAFSRKHAIAPEQTDLNALVKGVEALLRRVIGEDIDVRTNLEPGEMRALVDPVQIEQVIVNLATNARDAMPAGGTVSISTRAIDASESFARLHGLPAAGPYGLITVSDTGTGMDEQTRQRIFDPFFTTKGVGKGTGLGLSIVYGIVRQHKGSVSVYSEPGQGSTFSVHLPLSAEPAVLAERRAKSSPPGRGETILVAEDSDEVRRYVTRLLRSSGYDVIEAENGEDAVARFREHAERISLALLDVIMPKKSGREAYDEIRAIRPDVRALFFSGYTADIIEGKGLVDERLELLTKPVAPEELLSKVRAVLDR